MGERRPVVGVRLAEDEILMETGDLPPHRDHSAQLTAGELLARLKALADEWPDRPVEACEPDVDTGGGLRTRADYVVGAYGRDEGTGTHLLFCLVGATPAERGAAADGGGTPAYPGS